jgi:hypothetical protein
MYQKFLLEKNARESRKVRYQKTGTIDATRLANYKLSDDIFKARRMTPDGVSHGAVMMLDWSGSMDSKLLDLWFRAAEFVEFSKLSGVEVVVWAFTTQGGVSRGSADKYRDMLYSASKMIRIVDTVNCTMAENMERIRRFWTLVQLETGSGRGWAYQLREACRYKVSGLSTSGTNIWEAHSFGIHLAKGMRTDRKAVIVVSDGGDSWNWDGPVGGRQLLDVNASVEANEDVERTEYPDKWMPTLSGEDLGADRTESKYQNWPGDWDQRREALRRRADEAEKGSGVVTTGIYIGYLNDDSEKASLQFTYNTRFVVWPNWTNSNQNRASRTVKDNAFIGQLIKLIS